MGTYQKTSVLRIVADVLRIVAEYNGILLAWVGLPARTVVTPVVAANVYYVGSLLHGR